MDSGAEEENERPQKAEIGGRRGRGEGAAGGNYEVWGGINEVEKYSEGEFGPMYLHNPAGRAQLPLHLV